MSDANKDLVELARTTTEDLYALLAVPFDADEAAIKRAYRKASIKYHPDKNPDDAQAADRFIYLGWARDILADGELKGEYDGARARRREKALRDELLGGARRRMMEDLERRESAGAGVGVKRKRAGDMGEAERRECEVQRLAEDGKRRRKEAQDRRRRDEAVDANNSPAPAPAPAPRPGDSPALARTVKVRFPRAADTLSWDKATLARLFARYGPIDSVVMPKDKKLRDAGAKHRRLVAVAFLVYTRLDHAQAAVLDAKAHFPAIDAVAWAHGEPDLNTHIHTTSHVDAPLPVHAAPSAPSTPVAHSFRASFGPGIGAGKHTPLATPTFSFSPKTPSLEEVTMMRLKQAEKKRLEEQIRQQEAVEDDTTS